MRSLLQKSILSGGVHMSTDTSGMTQRMPSLDCAHQLTSMEVVLHEMKLSMPSCARYIWTLLTLSGLL